MFQITDEFGHVSSGTEAFIMKLRDSMHENDRRHGACEDDCERSVFVEGDSREDVDVFLSRPIRFLVDASEEQAMLDKTMETGFGFSLLYSHQNRVINAAERALQNELTKACAGCCDE